MAHITPPPLPAKTVLEKIAERFKTIAGDFYDLYEALEDVWLLGAYLRWPFWWLYYYFNYIGDKFYQADDLIRDIKRWIDGLVEGTVFQDLLYWLSSHFRTIRQDANNWVKWRIEDISSDLWTFINTPHVWVFRKIEDWVTWFYAFRQDPKGTIVTWLTDKYPWLASFLLDALAYIVNAVYVGIAFIRDLRDRPQSTIIDWLAQWYSWVRDFLTDPFSFIVGKVKAISAEVRLFFDNPIEWAREKIKQVLGLSDFDISDLPYYIFRRVLLNVLAYVDREYDMIRDRVCDIIMLFM